MAQLDRFLNLLVSNNATALNLSEGEVATVTIKDSARPVMKQALTSAQILNLVREISPSNAPPALDIHGNSRFEYSSTDGTFEVVLTQNGKISARIERKVVGSNGAKPAPAQPVTTVLPPAAPKVPTPKSEAPKVDAPRAEAAKASVNGDRGLDRIEGLLRMLVGHKASDLHLRAGSPPMLRANGEIEPIPGEAVLSSGDIDIMLNSVMLEQNREEFKEKIGRAHV